LVGCSTTNITFEPKPKKNLPDIKSHFDNAFNERNERRIKNEVLNSKLSEKSVWAIVAGAEGEGAVDKKPDKKIIESKIKKVEKTEKYGRFKTLKKPDGSMIVFGGVFTPEKKPSDFFNQKNLHNIPHVILVNYTEKTLEYYKGGEPVLGYAVVTPDASFLPAEEVWGQVQRIVKNPIWCPTANIRKKYPDLPKGCIPPQHKENAMGAIKFEISWQGVKGWDTIRLHGANGYPQNFFAEETSGCVRLQNDAIKNLVEKMGGEKAAKERIVILLSRR